LKSMSSQTFFGQLVEVKFGGVTSDADGVGGLVAADRRRLSGHVGVKLTPNGSASAAMLATRSARSSLVTNATFLRARLLIEEAAGSNVNVTVL
jgi:hypothetical protein